MSLTGLRSGARSEPIKIGTAQLVFFIGARVNSRAQRALLINYPGTTDRDNGVSLRCEQGRRRHYKGAVVAGTQRLLSRMNIAAAAVVRDSGKKISRSRGFHRDSHHRILQSVQSRSYVSTVLIMYRVHTIYGKEQQHGASIMVRGARTVYTILTHGASYC